MSSQALFSALEDIHKQDPLRIGDTENGKLEDGILYGLSTLTNLTDVDVHCDDSRVVLNTTLGKSQRRQLGSKNVSIELHELLGIWYAE